MKIDRLPMFHETFHAVSVFGKNTLSAGTRWNHSAVVCTHSTLLDERITSGNLRYGKIIYLFRHCISSNSENDENMFARINWFKDHPRQNWFKPHIAVIYSDFLD